MKDVRLFPLSLEAVRSFQNWGFHRDELFYDYNFPILSDGEAEDWFRWKTGSILSRYYAIYAEEEAVGYIGMKQINRLFGSACLGIVLNPDRLGIGYGSRALDLFLELFFLQERMRRMTLQVAPYNFRALALYEKAGFQKVGTFPFIYPNGRPPLERQEFSDIWAKAFHFGNTWILQGIRMELRAQEFLERR